MPDEAPITDTMPLFATALDAVDESPPVVPETPSALSLEPDENARYGYMIDGATGERRPKKRPGRQAKTLPTGPAAPADFTEKIERGEDRAPGANRVRKDKGKSAPKADTPAPPFRAGPIASGMNKMYARVGKIVKVWDHDIGSALISVSRKESDDDTTVGEAWEEIARTNPRIRAFLLRMLEGSAWSTLFMAHAPILLAILMKENIRKRLPFNQLFSAFLDPDDNGEASPVSENLGGIQTPDVNEMMKFAQTMMGDMFANMPRSAVLNPQTVVEMPENEWVPVPGGTEVELP